MSSQLLRICHLITDLDAGGAEAMLYKLVSFSNSNKGYEHYVVSLSGNGVYGRHLSDLGIPVYCLKMNEGRLGLLKLARLYGVLKKIRPHILQTWLYHADLLGLLFGKLLSDAPRVVWNVRCSNIEFKHYTYCLLYTSPSPRDRQKSRMPSSA